MPEYAFQQSETTVVPFLTHFSRRGISVSASRLSTTSMKTRPLSRSTPPKTQQPSTRWPRQYFLRPNLLSSKNRRKIGTYSIRIPTPCNCQLITSLEKLFLCCSVGRQEMSSLHDEIGRASCRERVFAFV